METLQQTVVEGKSILGNLPVETEKPETSQHDAHLLHENLPMVVSEADVKSQQALIESESALPTVQKAMPPGVPLIDLADLDLENSIHWRTEVDETTVEEYYEAIMAGAHFPRPKIDKKTKKVVDGNLTLMALSKALRDLARTDRDEDSEALASLRAEDLAMVPCELVEIPEDESPRMFCLKLNLTHGKRPSDQDMRAAAREWYQYNEGASFSELAKELMCSRKRAKRFVADLVEIYERDRTALVFDLHSQGVSQEEISRRLKERYPRGVGNSQTTVSDILSKHHDGAIAIRKKSQGSHSRKRKGGTPRNSGNGGSPTPPTSTSKEDAPGRKADAVPPQLTHEDQGTSEEPISRFPVSDSEYLEILAGPNGNSIMIKGVGLLPFDLRERLRSVIATAVSHIAEEARTLRSGEARPDESSPRSVTPRPVTGTTFKSVFRPSHGSRHVTHTVQ